MRSQFCFSENKFVSHFHQLSRVEKKFQASEALIDSSVHSIFGENLRILMKRDSVSVTSLAEILGTNQVQIRRLLNSESQPRAQTVALVEAFFGVDARILTQKLEDIETSQVADAHFDVVKKALFPQGVETRQHNLAEGFYQFWRPSFSRQDLYFSNIFKLSMVEGLMHCKMGEVGIYGERNRDGERLPIWRQRLRLIAMNSGLGTVLMGGGNRSVLVSTFMYLEMAQTPHNLRYAGFEQLGRSHHYQLPRLVPLVADKLSSDFSELMLAGRRSGFLEREAVPQSVLTYLEGNS